MKGNGILRYCAACGIEIEPPFWLCQTHAEEFGVDGIRYRDWPPELKQLKNNVCREIYDQNRGHFSIDEFGEDGIDIDEHGTLCTDSEPALRDEQFMQYAPYQDEEQNRVYRKTNHIKERPVM